jgi:Predicted hydrolases or acyltransferases (alpha/beta hydrolase superfamily)
MNYREEYIKSGKGEIALSIWDTGNDYPCIIFLPATMSYPAFWDDFLTRLSECEINVIGIHFVGHGKSERKTRKYSFSDMLQNVYDVITFTEKNFNSRIGVLGTSQGGILAVAAAGEDKRIKAVFSHNVMLPQLKESICITTFPKWSYHIMNGLMSIGAKLIPMLQLPIQFYLDLDKVFLSDEWKEKFFNDQLNLKKYSIYFLNSLFKADLNKVTDGSIECPVVIFASKGDRLFTSEYTQTVFELIKSKRKEIVLFDVNTHLIFNESLNTVFQPVVQKIKDLM